MFVLLVVNAGLTGCAGGKTKAEPSSSVSVNVHSDAVAQKSHSSAARAASIAQRQVGIPYLYGGADTTGFDCSGLVYYSYSNVGIQLPRTTGGLWQSLEPVSKDKLQTGDVLFFDIEGKMSHVGLYLGRGQFVHAPSSGRHVVIAELDSDFYRRALIRGGRAD
jgi:cell wall-associated NlpC family hydrolase